jgi:hypothetical protein
MRVDQLVLSGPSRAAEFQSLIRLASRFSAVFLALGLMSSLIFRKTLHGGHAYVFYQIPVNA